LDKLLVEVEMDGSALVLATAELYKAVFEEDEAFMNENPSFI
jgi:hypothetical protein